MGIKAGPKIVTNGLIFDLDAAVSRSYSGSGLTTYSIISGVGGSLLNGTGFSAINGGSFFFDGTNDYIRFTNSDIMGSVYTQNIWFRKNNTNTGLLADTGYAGALIYSNKIEFYYTNVSPYFLSANYTFTNGIWYCISLVRGATSKEIYLDGGLLASTASTDMYDTSGTNFIIGSNNGSVEFFIGNIAQVQIYNRALSAQEILQNYNATKGRYR